MFQVLPILVTLIPSAERTLLMFYDDDLPESWPFFRICYIISITYFGNTQMKVIYLSCVVIFKYGDVLPTLLSGLNHGPGKHKKLGDLLFL